MPLDWQWWSQPLRKRITFHVIIPVNGGVEICCGEGGAELKGKALNLPVVPRSDPAVASCDPQNQDANGLNVLPPQDVWALFYLGEEPVEVIQIGRTLPAHLPPGQVFHPLPTGGRPRTHWKNYISQHAWECLERWEV